MTTLGKMWQTLGNLLMLTGLYMLLFVGGLFADEQYNVYAASGANTEMAPGVAVSVGAAGGSGAPSMALPAAPEPVVVAPSQRAATPPGRAWGRKALPDQGIEAPSGTSAQPSNTDQRSSARPEQLMLPENRSSNAAPSVAFGSGPSAISRIVIPAIAVDKKVVEVGWTVEQQPDGQEVAVWQVDTYRVGHHQATSNPGAGGNIVLAGHSGGRAYPFNDIFYLKPGDLIQLTAAGQLYDYAVFEHILLDEVGQPLAKRLENARYIGPTDDEVITMVACWPLTGPNKFSQRIVIRAKPVTPPSAAQARDVTP